MSIQKRSYSRFRAKSEDEFENQFVITRTEKVTKQSISGKAFLPSTYSSIGISSVFIFLNLVY